MSIEIYYLKTVLPAVRDAAQKCGYAIGLHGSMTRDLDLIAVPWVDEVTTDAVLVETIRAAVSGWIVNDETADPNEFTKRNPQPKPRGRKAWSIQLGGGAYIDLSVMGVHVEGSPLAYMANSR